MERALRLTDKTNTNLGCTGCKLPDEVCVDMVLLPSDF